jgi:tRNA(Ile)-lysidine synthase
MKPKAQPLLIQALARLSLGSDAAIVVALSGGVDSTALLHAATLRWPGRVAAVHVHHGLQAAADAFVACCQHSCSALGVPLSVLHVQARHLPGESPEDAARRARYRAIADHVKTHFAGRSGHVLLAQHADDQLETVLLALSRGAGLAGLAAMPQIADRFGLAWHRPFLHLSAAQLRAHATEHGLTWMEDPSNADLRFTRNKIRLQVLPSLLQAFPSMRETAARSARHAASAQRVLQELAAQDEPLVGQPPAIAALQALSADRMALALRHWLKAQHQTTPSEAQIQALMRQIRSCTTRGHRIDLRVGAGHVRRVQSVLCFMPDAANGQDRPTPV